MQSHKGARERLCDFVVFGRNDSVKLEVKWDSLILKRTMKLKTIPYPTYLTQIPADGHHILAQQTSEHILVYQAFHPSIANCAVTHQRFGGPNYRFGRMTWIKPNFLWMMYRCGWASKPNQESVLGIWITKRGFLDILKAAVYSSYQPEIYTSREAWKQRVNESDVRLQWDPDHDPYGEKQARRAIQLGLRGKILDRFHGEMIAEIIDLTEFVREQKRLLDADGSNALIVPQETSFDVSDSQLRDRLRLSEG